VTDRKANLALFPRCQKRTIDVSFEGGDITSHGSGALLLRQAEQRTGLLQEVARRIGDDRRQKSVCHTLWGMLMQRVLGIALGHEDLDDHLTLRDDLALQTAVGSVKRLAHPTTLGRLERRSERGWAWEIHRVIVERFIASFDRPPEELVLDFDATDDAVHGKQVGRFFHGYYGHYCFLPLYVFCGSQLLVAYLRPSNIDGAKHAWAILALLTRRLRQAWPDVRIILRGDSGFCRWRMLRWCERHDVDYVVGVARNAVLERHAAPFLDEARLLLQASDKRSARVYGETRYAAKSWDKPRRVIIKAEQIPDKANPRFVVTSLREDAKAVYEKRYCPRGDMENRIKEQQLGLFADRTSSTRWWANQLRLLLSSLAYVLVETIRRVGLKGTHLATAQVWTIRLKLLKVGAVVLRNTRRVRLLLSSAFPDQKLFWTVARRLAA